jgi:hypothetical protein
MAGDWIKMRTGLTTSPKVVRMASALNVDRFRVAGGLLSVWSLFDAHSVDGILEGYTPGAVDELAAWHGFADSMIAVGWLEQNGASLAMPRFDSHNGASAKRRAQDTDRKRNDRKASAFDADENRTREEKRREEESKAIVIGEPSDGKPAKKKDTTPYEQIKQLYAKHLPDYPQPQELSQKRKAHIRKIWESEKCAHNPEFFARFFGYVNKSDFIRGMGVGIDWIINPANYLKIIEGNYENKP